MEETMEDTKGSERRRLTMDLDVHAGDFGFAFEEFEQRVEREDHCQVDQRDCQIGAHEIEGGGGGAFGFRHQVLHGD